VIDRKLQALPDLSRLKADADREDGHTFYVLNGGGLDTSLVYDVSTKEWHERAILDDCGEFKPMPYDTHCVGFGRHFVGGANVKICHLSQDYYSLDGEPLVRERVYTHIADERNRIRINELTIGVESGTGLQEGQGSDPLLMMSLSKDGGRIYNGWREKSIGKVGQYKADIVYRRLGVAKQFTFRIRFSDPVKFMICGSYIK